jgi:hypothetical protein
MLANDAKPIGIMAEIISNNREVPVNAKVTSDSGRRTACDVTAECVEAALKVGD